MSAEKVACIFTPELRRTGFEGAYPLSKSFRTEDGDYAHHETAVAWEVWNAAVDYALEEAFAVALARY